MCFCSYTFYSHLASEMTKCRGELVFKELELQRLKRDVASKASQISRMEESLHCMKNKLDSKTELGMLQFLFFY